MKSFGKYISKHLASFSLLVMLLLFINTFAFLLTFRNIITTDYGPTSPQIMLEKAVNASSEKGISEEMKQELGQNHI